jgi:CheY-like chemotaxis protein
VELNQDFNVSQYTLNHFQSRQQRQGPLIIALTAFLTPETIEKCRECGFNDWIESPLTKDKIQTQIVRILVERQE